MKALDTIRWSLQFSDHLTDGVVQDLRNHALVRATPGSKGGDGNHALWTLGHLSYVEGGVPWVILGEPNPVAHWKPLFDMGSQPSDDAGVYPSFDELLRTYRDLRAKNIRMLEQIGEEGLDRAPKNVPPGFEKEMRTIGQTFQVIAMHNMMHFGQLTDMRRAAGFKPRF